MPLPLDRSELLEELIQIGISLTSERDLALLPARILTEARRFTRAEAGTLYLLEGDHLRFMVVQNDMLARRLTKRGMRRLFESDLPLSEPSLAAYIALSRDILRLSDVYEIPPDRPYAFNRAIDAHTGYRTRSVLGVPLMEPSGRVIGVLQLINARNGSNQIVPFDQDYEPLIRALASQASVAVRNLQLEEAARVRAALRSVAGVATATAHQINNPLMVITGNLQLLVRDGQISDPVSHQRIDAVLAAVDMIHEAVGRLNRITEVKLAELSNAEGRPSP